MGPCVYRLLLRRVDRDQFRQQSFLDIDAFIYLYFAAHDMMLRFGQARVGWYVTRGVHVLSARLTCDENNNKHINIRLAIQTPISTSRQPCKTSTGERTLPCLSCSPMVY